MRPRGLAFAFAFGASVPMAGRTGQESRLEPSHRIPASCPSCALTTRFTDECSCATRSFRRRMRECGISCRAWEPFDETSTDCSSRSSSFERNGPSVGIDFNRFIVFVEFIAQEGRRAGVDVGGRLCGRPSFLGPWTCRASSDALLVVDFGLAERLESSRLLRVVDEGDEDRELAMYLSRK